MSSGEGEGRSWSDSVQDMINFCNRVLDYTAGIDLQTLLAVQVVYDATLHNLCLIGQAAAHVPESVRGDYPEIPWRPIVAARNHMMHRYFSIDDAILWEMVTIDVPTLLPNLRAMLQRSGEHT